jgi:hypothetical protein
MTKFAFGYFSIATNNYVHYWKAMIESAVIVFNSEDKVSFCVFTDQEDFCKEIAALYPQLNISVIAIESLKWPEATLLRYRIYKLYADKIDAEVLCHIDADMLFLANPFNFVSPDEWVNGVALVAHPGYFRASGDPIGTAQKLKDCFRIMKLGGLGTWETTIRSTAFVSRNKRNVYVCGGSWMAKSNDFVRMVSILDMNTEVDLLNGVVAKWHDESHLNRWASDNSFTLLNPSFCYDSSYKWLASIPEIIRAVRK